MVRVASIEPLAVSFRSDRGVDVVVERVGERSLLELLSFVVRDLSQICEGHSGAGELAGYFGWEFGLVRINYVALDVG